MFFIIENVLVIMYFSSYQCCFWFIFVNFINICLLQFNLTVAVCKVDVFSDTGLQSRDYHGLSFACLPDSLTNGKDLVYAVSRCW